MKSINGADCVSFQSGLFSPTYRENLNYTDLGGGRRKEKKVARGRNPTEYCTNPQPQNPSIHISTVHKIRKKRFRGSPICLVGRCWLTTTTSCFLNLWASVFIFLPFFFLLLFGLFLMRLVNWFRNWQFLFFSWRSLTQINLLKWKPGLLIFCECKTGTGSHNRITWTQPDRPIRNLGAFESQEFRRSHDCEASKIAKESVGSVRSAKSRGKNDCRMPDNETSLPDRTLSQF